MKSWQTDFLRGRNPIIQSINWFPRNSRVWKTFWRSQNAQNTQRYRRPHYLTPITQILICSKMLSSHSCHSEISLCSSVFCISKPPSKIRAWFHAAEAAALLQQLAIAGGHLATHHAHGQWPRVLHADVEGVRGLTPHGAAGGGIDDCLGLRHTRLVSFWALLGFDVT